MYNIYGNPKTLYVTNFLKFIDVVASTSCRIMQDWVINLHEGTKHLAFQTMG